MALTTVGALETHLGLDPSDPDSAQHRFLTQLLAGVEAAFLRLVDRQVEAREYVQHLGGRFSAVLLLPEYPVIEVTEVRLDERGGYGAVPGSFGESTTLTEGVDYLLVRDGRDAESETGRLLRRGTVWPGRWEYMPGLLTPRRLPGAGNVLVKYRAGFESIPADIPLAIWQIAALLRAQRKAGRPTLGEAYEEYSVRYGDPDYQRAWQAGSPAQVVARFRRMTPRFDVMG